jgi:hypothetical protein
MANGLAIKVGIGKKPMGGGDFGAPAGFGDTKAPMPPKEDMGDDSDVPKIPQATADKLINYIMSMTDDGSDQGDQGDDSGAPPSAPATPESGQGPGY